MQVRGWLPMLFFAADAELAPPSVREPYLVRDGDGWGRPYRVSTRALGRGTDPAGDPEVAADLKSGLQYSLLHAGRPDFEASDWLRLELVSAGRDGIHDTPDDLRLISYIPVGYTLHLSRSERALLRQLEAAFARGRHYFRIDGARWDLIDARLLAEFRLETMF